MADFVLKLGHWQTTSQTGTKIMSDNLFSRFAEKIIRSIHVEFKIPFIFGEIKLDATDATKEWWGGEQKQNDIEFAIKEAEANFYRENRDDKVAQILHDFSLAPDAEFQKVIAGLTKNINEEKVTWLAEIKIERWWDERITEDEVRNGLGLFLPYLRRELIKINEFRDVISALRLERIEELNEKTYAGVRRIETSLEKIFESRERRKEEEEPDFWYFPHTYGMQANFTGRKAEFKMLDEWLANDKHRLLVLRALGGFGKSALAWQWVNVHVNPKEYPKLIWWSFYESDASFDNFLTDTLKYLNVDIPQGQRNQVDEILKAMQGQKILFILDGFERILRAYSSTNASYQGLEEPKRTANDSDCVNPNAEILLKNMCVTQGIKSKALMTTRMTPRFVEPQDTQFIQGCVETELNEIKEDDAVVFLRAQGVRQGTNREINEACKTYGYHPLSLRLLAGRIANDFDNPGDIIVAQTIRIDGDLIQRQHHVLQVSYDILPANEQKLLSTIACFRSAITHDTLKAIAENKDALDIELHGLVERGLLFHDKRTKKFDLHPIVRHYAYDRFTDSERKKTHMNLAFHFIDIMPVTNRNVKTLEDLMPVIELYHHTVRAGKLDDAMVLFRDRLANTLYFQLGAYQLIVELLRALFLDGENKPPRLKDESAQAWTLNTLASAYGHIGQPHRAVPLFEMVNGLLEKAGDKGNLVTGLGNVAQVQLVIGALKAAERNLRRSIDLCLEIADEEWEGVGHSELGNVLIHLEQWNNSEMELSMGLSIFEKINHFQGQGYTWAYCALRFLFMARKEVILDTRKSNNEYRISAIESAQRALELAEERHKNISRPNVRDYIRAYWLLGTAYRTNNELEKAEENLAKALNLCRQINLVEVEADILLELARLSYAQKDFKDAQEKASEALMITERSGYVLQGADVNLFLAQYALEQENDKTKAKQYAEEAKKLAYCDGGEYKYKVAYEEAERLLERLK
ncbi:MAG: hypothetical protein HY867_14480 [Chloroflexi bacterium]|nr:hypothetical protein [Chloroflexota bacterium]